MGSTHFCLRNGCIGQLLFLFVLSFGFHFGEPIVIDAWFLEIRICGSFLAGLLTALTSVDLPLLSKILPLEDEVCGDQTEDRTFILLGLKGGDLYQIPSTVRWDRGAVCGYSDCLSYHEEYCWWERKWM